MSVGLLMQRDGNDLMSLPSRCIYVSGRCAPVKLSILVVAQVNGIVNLLAGGVEAGDEHHLVTVAAPDFVNASP